jgi:hypothetical protein
MAIIFTITQYFILSYIKHSNKDTRARTLHLGVTQILVSIAQYLLEGILVFGILQILTTQQYDLAIVYLSYAV